MKLLHCFFNNKISSGIALITAALCALVVDNLDMTHDLYHIFLNTPIEINIGVLKINKNILLWINDALMAVFFLLIGLEIKYEMINGTLASRQLAVLPVIAALGGMVVPALIYIIFNYHDPVTQIGWAIPITTDIAFTLGMISLLEKRISNSLKIFLMAIATIDDLVAIIIIAIFYTGNLSILSLSIALGSIVVLTLLNICNISRISIYILIGIVLWIAVMKSGIHATLAGVIVGFFIPMKEQVGTSPARKLKSVLHPWVAFIILPLFSFANAGVSFQAIMLHEMNLTLLLGIIAGLFIGKPLGISFFCWLMIKCKLASLPPRITFRQIIAIGVLCGIGFTMSIFIANLAFYFQDPKFISWAKISILTGSFLAALVGYLLLKMQVSKSNYIERN